MLVRALRIYTAHFLQAPDGGAPPRFGHLALGPHQETPRWTPFPISVRCQTLS